MFVLKTPLLGFKEYQIFLLVNNIYTHMMTLKTSLEYNHISMRSNAFLFLIIQIVHRGKENFENILK